MDESHSSRHRLCRSSRGCSLQSSAHGQNAAGQRRRRDCRSNHRRYGSAAAEDAPFSGYQWEERQDASDHGGYRNLFSPSNAWTDANGFLHLHVTKQGDDWVSAEVRLTRSLGYGNYRFVVRDISALEPAAVFAMFTLDDAGPSREMDIEVSRWGEPEDKSAQFVIQPYVVPANTVRFDAPEGLATYWIDWGLGRVAFRSDSGDAPHGRPGAVAEHLFGVVRWAETNS
jgi:hypothetical protein